MSAETFMWFLFGVGALVLVGIGLYAYHLFVRKDYYVEVDDMSMADLFKQYKKLPIATQDLIKDIAEGHDDS
tara:strand:- start:228 stop:443 length:216 start_codon:yes stop_codon:yes gene_type:complete